MVQVICLFFIAIKWHAWRQDNIVQTDSFGSLLCTK